MAMAFFVAIILILGVLCLEGLVAMFLWNCVIVALFAVNPIGYWLAVGIVLLINFIAGFFNHKK